MHFACCSLISAAFAIAVATVVPLVAVGVAFPIGVLVVVEVLVPWG